VLFVSHNMGAVAGLCARGIWIDSGEVRADGDADDVTTKYLATLSSGAFQFENRERGFAIQEVLLRDGEGRRRTAFAAGDDLVVDIAYESESRLAAPYVQVLIRSLHGTCFAASMQLDGHRPAYLEGSGRLACRFRSIPLLPQPYTVHVGVRASDGREWIVPTQEAVSFTVAGGPEDYGFRGEEFHSLVSRATSTFVPYEWELPDGTVSGVGLARNAAEEPVEAE
jgi:hypothetical protein